MPHRFDNTLGIVRDLGMTSSTFFYPYFTFFVMRLTSSIFSFSSGPFANNQRPGGFHLSCTGDSSGLKEVEIPCHSRHPSRILRWS